MLPKLPFDLPASALRRAVLGLLAGLPLSAASAQAISGVCPDGSIFIVQKESQVPCKAAKLVEPEDVPPIRPEYLPTPYTWQVYNETQDPNNPYNLIDAAREVRALRDGAAAGAGPNGASGSAPATSPGTATAAVAPPRDVAPLDLGLSEADVRDLYQLVELSQAAAPATFARETADGRGVFEVRLARSRAFEARLGEAWRSRGGLERGGVLLFTAHSKRPERFHANLTFIQGHLTFQPDATNARQLGILQGRLGELAGDEVVLGYVVLPEAIDLAQPIHAYWNDRHLEVRFPN